MWSKKCGCSILLAQLSLEHIQLKIYQIFNNTRWRFAKKANFFAHFCADAQEWSPEPFDKVKVKLLQGYSRKSHFFENYPNAGEPEDDPEPEQRELLVPFGVSGYGFLYRVEKAWFIFWLSVIREKAAVKLAIL